jgi:very-short-patch-repair endonuclease
MSKSQARLWRELRAHGTGFHFRREYPFGLITLDFYCHEAMLCVEVDGDQHGKKVFQDRARDKYLEKCGILVLRFASRECFYRAKGVAAQIRQVCIERAGRDPFSTPS